MVEVLFFYMEGNISSVAKKIYKSLGIQKGNLYSGDSSHVLNGVYYDFSILGSKIKIEYNSYDYEDKYNYMLSIKEDVNSGLKVNDEMIKQLTVIICELLVNNLNLNIAHEGENGQLFFFAPSFP